MKIKICGLKRTEDVDYVNQYKPDYAGFVFAGTKRKIDFNTAKRLKRRLDSDIPAVGVFVNEDMALIKHLAEENVIDCVQLHGDETEDYIVTLRKKLEEISRKNVTIIKAVRVKTREQVLEAEKLSVDFLLLDAFTAEEYGGSGKVFNHDLIPKLSKPYFLAGGITSENVTSILQTLKDRDNLPYCVDVSSSVETEGFKDKDKIRKMVESIRNAIEK
jgi:phosphoribosylanthranilate isomerase